MIKVRLESDEKLNLAQLEATKVEPKRVKEAAQTQMMRPK
jgi:hypothetical protein